ncbi:2-dehydropantoate 2-reductase [Actinocrispum wychmicini]|uniref:2-dehydropantoate 2-reductase n=1 Tax=Actinocrispum wychmicini TaxID=1213861 RepID=A0A4R2IY35_9PSEU|nr:2-dehydropantoate 2-reductase [Actinocrispum wychmicini]TCO50821.1 2-dehydropantoate 2-reductase [Actinocrispum wychmicini]
MRIAVLGTGGVGGYFGGRLARAGHDVSFVARGAHLAALRQDGLAVTSVEGDFTVSPVRATEDTKEIGEVDYVLLGVKTWQLGHAIAALRPLVGPDTAVLTTQNGVDAPRQVADIVGEGAVLPGAVEVIAYIDGPGRIRQIGGGKLTFAEWDSRPSDRVERLRAAVAEAGLAAVVSTDIWGALWTKFLTLASIGALGTVTDAPFGVVRSRPGTRRLIEDSMTEVLQVARAKGIDLPDDVIQARMAFLDDMPAAATTSLQRDILAGKQSELAAWTGAAVRLGQETGTPTPVSSLLYELISARVSARTQP